MKGFKKITKEELEKQRVEMRYEWLLKNGFNEETAKKVMKKEMEGGEQNAER